MTLAFELSNGLEFSDWSDEFLPLRGVLFLSITILAGDLIVFSEEFTTTFSFLLTEIMGDSDWNEEDRLRIDGHKPSGVLLLSKRHVVL